MELKDSIVRPVVKRLVPCPDCEGEGVGGSNIYGYGICQICRGTGQLCKIKGICDNCGDEFWVVVGTKSYWAHVECGRCRVNRALGFDPDEENV